MRNKSSEEGDALLAVSQQSLFLLCGIWFDHSLYHFIPQNVAEIEVTPSAQGLQWQELFPAAVYSLLHHCCSSARRTTGGFAHWTYPLSTLPCPKYNLHTRFISSSRIPLQRAGIHTNIKYVYSCSGGFKGQQMSPHAQAANNSSRPFMVDKCLLSCPVKAICLVINRMVNLQDSA